MCNGACLHQVGSGSSGSDMLLVTPPGVGVVVYPRVTGEFVGTAEAFGASRECASMGFLSSVRPDMASLMLETVEGLVT